jgi:hypothetical protein
MTDSTSTHLQACEVRAEPQGDLQLSTALVLAPIYLLHRVPAVRHGCCIMASATPSKQESTLDDIGMREQATPMLNQCCLQLPPLHHRPRIAFQLTRRLSQPAHQVGLLRSASATMASKLRPPSIAAWPHADRTGTLTAPRYLSLRSVFLSHTLQAWLAAAWDTFMAGR